jgi:mono/diheme cytochrome c family protein
MRKFVAVTAALALLAGCGEEKDHRGIELMPDMFHQPAYEGQDAWTTPDGRTQVPMAMAPVPGTVPRSGAVYNLAVSDWEGAKALVNPLLPTAAVLTAGQRDYQINCAVCHGTDGNAGHASMTPFFSGVPSLTGETYSVLSDGEIYHIIAKGRNRMPALAGQVPDERRWQIVTYLRALQTAAVATAKGGDALKALLAEPGAKAMVPPPAPRPEYKPVEWIQPGATP